jgi:hypothetical protein
MHLLRPLESRLAAVVEDETLLRQELVSYIPAIFATLSTALWMIIFQANGLPSLAYIYLASSCSPH